MKRNPFTISGYIGPEFFCDRESETIKILNALKNQRNLTLLSYRRLGKTGLIHHVFNKLKNEKDFNVFYIDLMQTSNLTDFTERFAKSMIGKFDKRKTSLLKTFGRIVKSLKPVVSFDPITGSPQIEIKSVQQDDPHLSLEELFRFLQIQKGQTIIGLDEFQQIQNYPEENIEAIFRSHIQQIKNTTFIFSGSEKHMLTSMFGDYSRPFYQSTEVMNLEKIASEDYSEFIQLTFDKYKRKIDHESIDLILDTTENYTFYVQFLCNKLYGSGINRITPKVVLEMMESILKEQEVVYYNYKNLLTGQQFELLKAIAKENGIEKPTSIDFIQKYKLRAASSVRTSLQSLLNKEMIYFDKGRYYVYDVFFSKWLQQK